MRESTLPTNYLWATIKNRLYVLINSYIGVHIGGIEIGLAMSGRVKTHCAVSSRVQRDIDVINKNLT